MINLEKYHNEIKKIGKEFAVDKENSNPLECASMPSCKFCKFYSAINRNLSCKETRLYYGELIDDDLLCEQLSEEQLKWIIDNSIWLERWLGL